MRLCSTCQQLPRPAEPTGPGHFATRFGDRCTVHLNDIDVSGACNEGDAIEGWVHMFDLDATGSRVACEECGQEVAVVRRYGLIEAVRA